MNDTTEAASKLRDAYVELIELAAIFARGDNVPDWSNHKWYISTPMRERTEVLGMLRDIQFTMQQYGIKLRAIAEKISAELGSNIKSPKDALMSEFPHPNDQVYIIWRCSLGDSVGSVVESLRQYREFVTNHKHSSLIKCE